MREIAYESLKLFLIIGSIASIIFGIMLYLRPDKLERVNNYLNHWYSERKKMKPLEIMHETDNYYYKNNKLFGWIMIIASAIGLYIFFFKFPAEPFTDDQLYTLSAQIFIDIFIKSLRIFFIIFFILGLPVWILLINNPEKLKKVSHFFNQWISTRLMLLPLENMHFGFDTFVLKHNRIFGLIFVLFATFILITFLITV